MISTTNLEFLAATTSLYDGLVRQAEARTRDQGIVTINARHRWRLLKWEVDRRLERMARLVHVAYELNGVKFEHTVEIPDDGGRIAADRLAQEKFAQQLAAELTREIVGALANAGQ